MQILDLDIWHIETFQQDGECRRSKDFPLCPDDNLLPEHNPDCLTVVAVP